MWINIGMSAIGMNEEWFLHVARHGMTSQAPHLRCVPLGDLKKEVCIHVALMLTSDVGWSEEDISYSVGCGFEL
jgi:hypothetical protein